MGKPVVGEVVVIPFPQTDLKTGKRRPALVLVDLPGDDVILCQITSHVRSMNHQSHWTLPTLNAESSISRVLFVRNGSSPLSTASFFIRLEIRATKLSEVLTKARTLFN